MDFIYIFIGANLVNVIIQTIKSLLTVNGNKWSASFGNALAYAFYTYIIVLTTNDTLSTFDKALIVGGCNLVGVFVVKLIEEKTQKDKLWIFNTTIVEDNTTVRNIASLLKEMGIACIYNEVVKDRLYTMNIYSYTSKESEMIKSILANYNIKFSVIESKFSNKILDKSND